MIPFKFNYFRTTPFQHDQVKQQIVLKLSPVHYTVQ